MGKHSEGKRWNDSITYALSRRPSTKPYSDPGMAGFGMVVSATSARWHVRVSVTENGKRKFHEKTLGFVARAGDVADGEFTLTLTQAQDQARAWQRFMKLPAAEREKRDADRAAENICLETIIVPFLAERRTKNGTHLAATTVEGYRACYERYLQPYKHWPLVEYQRKVSEWQQVIKKIDSEHSNSWAWHTLNLLSGIYNFLQTKQLCDFNPLSNVRRTRIIKRTPVRKASVSTLDLPKFVTQLQTTRGRNSKEAALMMLLGGFRGSAVMQLKWEHVDLSNKMLKIPAVDDQTEVCPVEAPQPGTAVDSIVVVESGMPGWKGFSGDYPLNDAVFEILQRRHEVREHGAVYVFPARHGDQPHMVDIRGALERGSEGLGVKVYRHMLRKTFGTIANVVFPGDIMLIGALLTHRWALPDAPQAGVTSDYLVATERMRIATNRVADVIQQIAGMKPLTEETIAMLKRAAIDTSKLTITATPDDDDE